MNRITTFKIEIHEYLSRIVEINAENAEAAVAQVKAMYQQEEVILDSTDHETTEISEVE